MEKDVLIVGAGPVGLVMAIELARYGVGVRLIDKEAQRTDKSKALVIWSRSLELLERRDVARVWSMRATGLLRSTSRRTGNRSRE
jgi:2-polyprenyl-6-methoxyphenol hydroxylase-like FAD-dependent oxidoreductase